jgi:hypothetical protein
VQHSSIAPCKYEYPLHPADEREPLKDTASTTFLSASGTVFFRPCANLEIKLIQYRSYLPFQRLKAPIPAVEIRFVMLDPAKHLTRTL